MNKKDLTEAEIRTRYITPAINQTAGWDFVNMREEFTMGKIHVRGKAVRRGKRKAADYLLFYKRDIPIAIVEAKDNNHSADGGLQQALEYAEILDIPFAFSSNGDGFTEHDRTVTAGKITREFGMDEFPTPEQLWERYKSWKQISPKEVDKKSERILNGNT